MAWITITELREDRLPVEGDGISDAEIAEAIGSAIEEVVGILGSSAESSVLAQSAVASLAHADVLDIIFPRDAREPGSEATSYRLAAERKIARYLEIHQQQDDDPSTADVPPVIVYASGPATLQVRDERY